MHPFKEDIKEILHLMDKATDADMALVQHAADFAGEAHKDHKRFKGEPHYIHLYGTAKKLAELHMGAVTIAAGFLHDVIEDTVVTPEILEEHFGKEIRFLVEGVTKLKKLKYHGEERSINSMRKLFVAMAKDIRVLIIKLCDRTHNMETLGDRFPHKQQRVAMETMEIYAPLAYRLGMRKINRELEDLVFPYVYPEGYKEMKKILKIDFDKTHSAIEKFQKMLKKLLVKNRVINIKTEVRVKSLYSLYKKYLKKEKDLSQIYDINAIRLIVPTVADCYIALGIIHSAWTPLPGRIKDYIALPKTNGYQSIHTTIFLGDGNIAEIQIRTEEMHQEAEFGITSHLVYKDGSKKPTKNSGLIWIKYLLPQAKSDSSLPASNSDIPLWIKQLAETQESITDGNELMENLRKDFFERRIFVFTPKGAVIDLPIDSSPIDFAYAVHSDIGDHMSGVKVNGKMVSIESPLKSGDIVEVQTKHSAHPTQKWLQLVRTNLAKKQIRSYLHLLN